MKIFKKTVITRLQSAVNRDRKLNEKYVKQHRELFDTITFKREQQSQLEQAQRLEKMLRYCIASEESEEIKRAVYDMEEN